MYNAKKAIDCFMPLIGWRQNVDRSRRITDTLLLKSDSNRYYQDYHPTITHNNLLSLMEDISLVDFDIFDAGTTYLKGEIVRSEQTEPNTIYYQRLTDGQGEPLTESTAWEVVQIDEYWHWLRQENESAILQALDDWVSEHLNSIVSDDIIDSQQVWKLSGDGSTIEKDDFFVYHQIDLKHDNHLVTTIHEISLYFDTIGSYEILLFKSGQTTPFRTVPVDYVEANTIQWVAVQDWELPHDGSTYWLGYNQNNVPGKAYDQTKVLSTSSMYGVEGLYSVYQVCTETFELRPGKTPYIDSAPISEIWDFSTNRFDSALGSIGLNFRYTTTCDFSDFLERNKYKFVSIIGLQMAIRLLQIFINNPSAKINRHKEVMSKAELRFELGGDSRNPASGGLEKKYKKALKALTVSRSQISSHCLPCGKGTVSFKHYSN